MSSYSILEDRNRGLQFAQVFLTTVGQVFESSADSIPVANSQEKPRIMNNSEYNWICRGTKSEPHPEFEVEANRKCDICGQDEASAKSRKKTALPIGIVGGANRFNVVGWLWYLVVFSSQVTTNSWRFSNSARTAKR